MNTLPILWSEVGLAILALGIFIADIFIPSDEHREKIIFWTALGGLTLLFIGHCVWGAHAASAFEDSFIQDAFSFLFKALFYSAGFFTLCMAQGYSSRLQTGRVEFLLLILLALLGMMALVSANDFVLFFVAIELLSVSLYVMTAYLRDEEKSIEAGAKLLILGALSSVIFLFGLSFIYGSCGSTSFIAIHEFLLTKTAMPPAFIFGATLVVVSLGFKIAAVPFGFWAPDVYEGAPAPVTGFLSMGSKIAAVAALMRLLSTIFVPLESKLIWVFAIFAALSIIYGNFGAIAQKNLKRLLGYSSIGHTGYLLVGLAAWKESGSEAMLY